MKLPLSAIGITDVLIAYRDCPRRMSYGMRRHTGAGQQSDERTPEAGSWATAYGSAIHDAIQAVEDGYGVEAAIQVAWNRHGSLLEPGDVQLLRDDLDTYARRDFPGTLTRASEDEYRVPLLEHGGETIYFRFKLDRLYERADAPGVFIHVDYKSSKHPKSEKEVHEDPQMWAYNWGIHEVFPGVRGPPPVLRPAPLRPGADPQERGAARADPRLARASGHGHPRGRRRARGRPPQAAEEPWCRWCPIMESCPVVDELTEFGLVEIASAAPQEKIGRKKVVQLAEAAVPEYAAQLDDVKEAIGVLERFRDAVTDVIKEMPEDRRRELGYETRERTNNVFGREAALALLDRLGPERFAEIAKVTKSGLESNLAENPELLAWALELAESVAGATTLYRAA
jgi:hypothetical protein